MPAGEQSPSLGSLNGLQAAIAKASAGLMRKARSGGAPGQLVFPIGLRALQRLVIPPVEDSAATYSWRLDDIRVADVGGDLMLALDDQRRHAPSKPVVLLRFELVNLHFVVHWLLTCEPGPCLTARRLALPHLLHHLADRVAGGIIGKKRRPVSASSAPRSGLVFTIALTFPEARAGISRRLQAVPSAIDLHSCSTEGLELELNTHRIGGRTAELLEWWENTKRGERTLKSLAEGIICESLMDTALVQDAMKPWLAGAGKIDDGTYVGVKHEASSSSRRSRAANQPPFEMVLASGAPYLYTGEPYVDATGLDFAKGEHVFKGSLFVRVHAESGPAGIAGSGSNPTGRLSAPTRLACIACRSAPLPQARRRR